MDEEESVFPLSATPLSALAALWLAVDVGIHCLAFLKGGA
jgi:hypothetical protein